MAPSLLSQASDDIGLIWGGRNTPAPPFRPATAVIADDYIHIGGKYITAVLYQKGHAVSGYRLMIVDSDRVVAATAESKSRREADAASQQRKNVDSIKF